MGTSPLELNTEESFVQAQILTVAGQVAKVPGSLGKFFPAEAVKWSGWQACATPRGGWGIAWGPI